MKMTDKINELNKRKEVLHASYKETHDKIKNKFEEIMYSLFLNKHGATFHRFIINRSIYRGYKVMFELCFMDEEGKSDFGSDATFYFESEDGFLKTNYGTMGTYSKHDIYQVKRVHLISDIFDNIEEVENILKELVSGEECAALAEIDQEIDEIESEIYKIKQEYRNNELKNIEDNLKPGSIVEYDSKVRYYYRKFHGPYRLLKISQKTVTISNCDGAKRINKKEFLQDIYDGHILVKDA